MLIAFILGVPVPLAALAAAAALLITRRIKPQRVFNEVDFTLLVFFAGLFIVTGAIERSGLSGRLFELGRPLVPQLPDPDRAWLTPAMATTFAGNLTL